MSVQTLLIALVAVALVYFVARRYAGAWWKFRGQRVITCPENIQPAGVLVDAKHAADTSFGTPDLRLSACSRWPERAGCGQECLRQIEASPEDCLVRNILAKWYEGKSCVYCGKPIGEIQWADRKPALLAPQQVTVDWSQIAPQDLPATLVNAQPVCFSCHIANTLVREHPELIVDRTRPA